MKKPDLVAKLDPATEEDLSRVKSKKLGFSSLVLVANKEEKVKFEDKLFNSFLHAQATENICCWSR